MKVDVAFYSPMCNHILHFRRNAAGKRLSRLVYQAHLGLLHPVHLATPCTTHTVGATSSLWSIRTEALLIGEFAGLVLRVACREVGKTRRSSRRQVWALRRVLAPSSWTGIRKGTLRSCCNVAKRQAWALACIRYQKHPQISAVNAFKRGSLSVLCLRRSERKSTPIPQDNRIL